MRVNVFTVFHIRTIRTCSQFGEQLYRNFPVKNRSAYRKLYNTERQHCGHEAGNHVGYGGSARRART